MKNINDINSIQIILQADDRLLLHIVLSRGGTVQRLGTGTLDNNERDLLSGVIGIETFDEVLQLLPADLLLTDASYSDPNLRGTRIGLSIALIADEWECSFQMIYGSESEGPPNDVVAFVSAARNLTEKWYQEFKERTS